MHTIIIDDVMFKRLAKADYSLKIYVSKMVRKLKTLGPRAGKLLDHHVFLYECKMKRPPIRLYYHFDISTGKNGCWILTLRKVTSDRKIESRS